MIFLQFKGIIYYHTNLPKRRIIMPIFNPKMSLSDIHNNLNLSFENKPSSFLLIPSSLNLLSLISTNPWVESIFMSLSPSSDFLCWKMFLAFLLTLCSSIFLTSPMSFVSSFHKIPDASQFSRFRTNYHANLADMFRNLVDITEPICRKINEKKAKYLIYDTSGIELPVKENNPKFLETKLNEAKKLSSTKKDSSDSSPYAIAYSRLPDFASANPEARQQYINGHFCYALKMDWVFQDSFPSLMKILNQHILKQLLKKLIILMLTRKSLMQNP